MFDASVIHAVMDRLRPGWRERVAIRKKNPWTVVAVMLALFCGGFIWYYSFQLMWAVHLMAYPQHRGHLREFWPDGISFRAFVSSFLMLMPLGLSSLFLGAMVGNLILWCDSLTRRSLEDQAKLDPQLGFRYVMLELCVWTFVVCLVCLALSVTGALTLSQLK